MESHALGLYVVATPLGHLGDLTTRLLRLARVDREELRPRLIPTNPAELVDRSIRRYSKLWPDRKLSFEQGEVREVRIDPELVLTGLLPPLLYAATAKLSLFDFRRNITATALMSVVLVLFTTAVVGTVAWWLLPGAAA